jgi:hypothetical protein
VPSPQTLYRIEILSKNMRSIDMVFVKRIISRRDFYHKECPERLDLQVLCFEAPADNDWEPLNYAGL